MYVGAASQHVLRMSLVPEQEARNFDSHHMEKTSQRFQKIATTLADLHAGGLNAQ